jgi:hypothetical protein
MLRSPRHDTLVRGSVVVEALATDDVGMDRVEFYVDDILFDVDAAPPYRMLWDTTQEGDGEYELGVVAYDLAGNETTSSVHTVTAHNFDGGGNAQYNDWLGAPICFAEGTECYSGDRIDGRGVYEANQPNTLDDCPDGEEGDYRSGAQLDSLHIFTSNGLPMVTGGEVTLEATVWAGDTGTEALDLFYATNAKYPDWSYLTTLYPEGGMSQVLTTSFTLPMWVKYMAVRGVFRTEADDIGEACAPHGWTDHDDLVIAVSNGSDDWFE